MKKLLRLFQTLLNRLRRPVSLEAAIGFANPEPVFDTSVWNVQPGHLVPTTVSVSSGPWVQSGFSGNIVYSSVTVNGSSGMSLWSQQQASLGQYGQGLSNMGQGLMNYDPAYDPRVFGNEQSANIRNSLQQSNLR